MTKKSKVKASKVNKKLNKGITPNEQGRLLTRIPPIPSNPIHRFRRALSRQFSWNPGTNAIDGLAGSSSLQITFSPSVTDWRIAGVSIYNDALPGVTEFSALYDQWSIANVVLRWDMQSSIYTNSGATYGSPLLLHMMDYDDTTDPGLAGILQYPQVRTHCFSKGGYDPLILNLTPRPLMDVAGSGISTNYSPMEVNPFLKTSDMSTPHYCFKSQFQNFGASASVLIVFQITLYYDLEFTNPK
jgi:hypothetical protein